MKNEKNILDWFNRILSKENLKNSEGTTDAKFYEKLAHYSAQLDVPKIDIEKALSNFEERKSQTKKQNKVISFNFKKVYKYAAVLLILLTTSYFLLYNNIASFNTQFAETKTFSLPDNSEVILNANSAVEFNKKNWKNNRELTLDGEAYFKVSKGNKFDVKTSVGTISVVGTQFNVKERSNYFEVKCYEGIVNVAYKNTTKQLTKGKIFRVIKQQIDTLSSFNVNDKSWLVNESTFTNVPLEVVLNELENQFTISIQTKDVNTNQLYSGGFTHNDINIALQSVTVPLQLSYKIKNKTVIIYNYGD